MYKKTYVMVLIVVYMIFVMCSVFATNGSLSISVGGGITLQQRDSINIFQDTSPGYNLTLVGLGNYAEFPFSLNVLSSIYIAADSDVSEVAFSYTNPFFSGERWVDENLRILFFAGPALGLDVYVGQIEASVGILFEGRFFKGPYELDSDDAIWGHPIGTNIVGTLGVGGNVAVRVTRNKTSSKGLSIGCLVGILSGEYVLKAAQMGEYRWNEGKYSSLIHPYLCITF